MPSTANGVRLTGLEQTASFRGACSISMKIFYQHTLCVAVVFLSCFVVGGHATTKLERLMAENEKLKQLNIRLKELVRAKVGSSRIANRVANSPSFLELKEGSSSGIQAEEDPAKASNPKKKCVDIDDMAGVGEAENNFCLAPDMCRETLYSCKRNCVNRCWVEKYGKNGAPPGYGDIDQSIIRHQSTRKTNVATSEHRFRLQAVFKHEGQATPRHASTQAQTGRESCEETHCCG